jgi:predicted dehydrogenase
MGLYGTMRFADDVVAQFESSFLAPQRQFLPVVGEEGVLTVESPYRIDWPGEARLARGDEVKVLDVPEADSYRLQLENLADAIAGAAAPRLGRDDALGQARAIEALYRSAAEGRTIPVSP